MIDQIVKEIDAIESQWLKVDRIEIGEKQARALAEELSAPWHLQNRLGVTWDNTAVPPIEWQRIVAGDGWMFGIPVRGVESPDYLLVVAGERWNP